MFDLPESVGSLVADYTSDEFLQIDSICKASPLFQEAMTRFKLPEGFILQIDPWPYGGPDPGEKVPRYIQGL